MTVPARASLVWLAGLLACAASEPPPAPTPPPTPSPQPSPTAPQPERYAVDVQRTVKGRHARNWFSEDTRSSFVLTLDPDGVARACRGKRSRSHNDGPTVHRSTDLREQQGYRGAWSRDGEWLQLDLLPDPVVCPQTRAYLDLEPRSWHLRCRLELRSEHPASLLACTLTDRNKHIYDEARSHLVPGVLREPTLLLGRDDGLRVEWDESHVPPDDGAPTVRLRPAPDPVRDDTWSVK